MEVQCASKLSSVKGSEKAPTRSIMASPMRIDRQFCDSRQPSCSIGLINEAQGSCRLHYGKTTATSIIYGPSAPKYGRHEDSSSMSVEVIFSTSLGGGNGAGDAFVGAGQELKRVEREGSKFIRAGLLPAIDVSRCPRTLLVAKVIVDFDDGNALSVAFNACVMALLNAGVSMLYTPVAIGTAFLSPSSSTRTIFTQSEGEKNSNKEMKVLCVDPNKEEESLVVASFQLVMRGSADLAVALTRCKGTFSEDDLAEASALSAKSAAAIVDFMSQVDF